ncbi:phenylacetate--CoA ligase family protein [Microbacterium sp. NPDC090218]
MKRGIFDAKTRLLMSGDRRAFAAMLENERLGDREFEGLATAAATRIALHAYDSSTFYRDLYTGAGFGREDVAEHRNFGQLPVVTKAALREAGDTVLSSAVPSRRALMSQTGGSTGAPLRVRNDAAAPTAPMWWRIYRWWDVHPADDMAFIYRRLRQGREAVKYAAQWWPSRHIHLDARAISDDAIEEFAERWDRVRPRLLVAYVEGATAVATHLAKTGRTLPTTAVSVTAATLQPGQRALLESVFRAPVYDTYRSAEIPWIAAECPQHEGLHVAGDQRLVEIVDDAGRTVTPGVDGSVIVTDFSNEVYPLVRYEMGDRSRLLDGRCECGRVFPRIAPVQGRLADVVRTPSGRRITGGLSGLFLGDPDAIRQMQIVQASDYSISIRYVATRPGGATDAAARAARALTELLGEDVGVTTIEVANIESQGGKARLVISEAPESL